MNAIGYFKEDSRDKLLINVTTSDQTQLDNWSKLRLLYPEIMSTCVTNDWVVQSIRAQKRFSRLYEFIGTNTLILCADPDKEVSTISSEIFFLRINSINIFMFESYSLLPYKLRYQVQFIFVFFTRFLCVEVAIAAFTFV